jgi:hypothetical protein
MKSSARPTPIFQSAAVILALLFAPCLQRAEAGTLDFPLYGFEIEALDAAPGAETAPALAMSLPGVRGFAANINVNIQPYKGTMKEYVALSKGQFGQMKWKVIAEETKGDAEWRAEYSATMNGNSMHFYSRALQKGDHVYLVTATAEESQWAGLQARLRKHVDSMKLK